MPAVGTFLAGVVSAAAPAAAVFTGTATATALTSTIVGRLLTTVALTALSRALLPKPHVTTPGIRTTQTMTGGVTPASFILGRYATEGQLVCPPMSHGRVGKTPNAFLTYVIELGDIPGQTLHSLIVDGKACVPDLTNPHADYGYRLPELAHPDTGEETAWVRYYDGSQTSVDPMLLDIYGDYPQRPWTAQMIGAGICYAVLTFQYARDLYTGFPKVRFVLGGIPLYDPRADSSVGGIGPQRWDAPATWQPSENPAVQIYNILRGISLPGGHVWGGDAGAGDLPLANWTAAMAAADEAISLSGGGSMPAWRSAYEVYVGDEPASVIEELLKACSGQIAEIGGTWKLRIGAPALPVFFFSDDDINISASQTFDPFPSISETYNGVHASYPSPAALWTSRDAPPRYDASAEASDGGRRLIADLSLPACPYDRQVQRVMRAGLREERRMRRHVVTLAPEAIALEPLDVVAWTSPRNGYEAKRFEVVSIVDPMVTSKPVVSLRERNPEDYDWEPGDDIVTAIPSVQPVDPAAYVFSAWTVAGVLIENAAGTRKRPALKVSWSPLLLGDSTGLRVQVRRSGQADLVAQTTTSDLDEGKVILSAGILSGEAYEVRVRLARRQRTAWSEWSPVTAPTARLTSADFDPSNLLGRWVSQNPVFSAWDGPWPEGLLITVQQGAVTPQPGMGKYGTAILMETAETPTQNRPFIVIDGASDSGNATHKAHHVQRILVRAELELVAGDNWNGARITAGWHGQSTVWAHHYLDDGPMKSGTGAIQMVEAILERPSDYVQATSDDPVNVHLYATSGGGKGFGAHKIRVHSFDYQVIDASPSVWFYQAAKSTDALRAAAYVARVSAGGAEAGFEMVAADDPVQGAASNIRFNADKILLDGTLKADHIDAGSFFASGLSVFNGTLKSSNFAAGSAGWRIQNGGNAEFNNLVVRSWMQKGAVSRIIPYYASSAAAQEAYDDAFTVSLGAFSDDMIWRMACHVRWRSRRKWTTANPQDGGFDINWEKIQLRLQWRTKLSGTWSGWSMLHNFGTSGANALWNTGDIVLNAFGVFDQVQVRLWASSEIAMSGKATSAYEIFYNNIDDIAFVARAEEV